MLTVVGSEAVTGVIVAGVLVLEFFISAFSLQEVQIFSEHKVMEVIGVCLTSS